MSFPLEITKNFIEINNIEPPIIDGSSLDFLKGILDVGIQDLKEKKDYMIISETIDYYDIDSDIFLKVTPSETFKISLQLDTQQSRTQIFFLDFKFYFFCCW